jgi:predicted DNA-binding protein
MVDRDKMLNVRITDDEDRMLKALAEHQGLTSSDIIRQYIRRAFAEAFPPKKTRR